MQTIPLFQAFTWCPYGMSKAFTILLTLFLKCNCTCLKVVFSPWKVGIKPQKTSGPLVWTERISSLLHLPKNWKGGELSSNFTIFSCLLAWYSSSFTSACSLFLALSRHLSSCFASSRAIALPRSQLQKQRQDKLCEQHKPVIAVVLFAEWRHFQTSFRGPGYMLH